MAEQKFKHISVGKNGGVWAAGETDGAIYRLFGDADLVGWVPDKVGKAEVIAAVDFGNAWCVNKKGEIWRVTNAENLDKGGAWTQIPTHSGQADAATISVGADGAIWYAQTDGTMFRRGPDTWFQDPVGKAAVIAAFSKAEVYCVNKKQEIWYAGNADWEGGGGPWTKFKTYSGKADAKTISVGSDRSLWYANTAGDLFFYLMHGDTWRPGWSQDKMGAANAISVNTQGDVWCVNKRGEVWRTLDNKWQRVVESEPPQEKVWRYTVRKDDVGLMAIVRKEFKLKDPQDSKEINRLVDLIVAKNREHIPHLTRDMIKAGDVLTLRY